MKKTEIDKYIDSRAKFPLMSWDIFSQFADGNFKRITKREDELNQLFYFDSIYNWKNNVRNIIETNDYEALVLTNSEQKILWVNDGFTKMTGYTKEFAKNKRPKFLQGRRSQPQRETIRKKLKRGLPFKEVIVNYKKDGTAYECELHIFPLVSENSLHYLALENAV